MIQMTTSSKEVKSQIRKKVWSEMEKKNVAAFPRPVYGRIPNFIGSEKAANRLFSKDFWIYSRAIKVNPDAPQRVVREKALRDGKLLIMPTPRIREGFLLLDPRFIPKHAIRVASTISGAFRYGKLIKVEEIPQIDLIVTGSVAVNKKGARIGKGGGYAELEYAILKEYKKIGDKTPIVTTVHDIQVLDIEWPVEKHDLFVDWIFTPKKEIKIEGKKPRPEGLYWDLLDAEKIFKIPILRKLFNKRKETQGGNI